MNSPLDPRESLLRLGAQVLDALFEAERLEASLPSGCLDYMREVGGPPTPAQLEHFTDHFFGGDPMKTLIALAEFRIAQDKLQMTSDQYVTLRAALELNESGRTNLDLDKVMDIFGVDDGIRSPIPHWEPKTSSHDTHDQLPDDPTPEDLKPCGNPRRHDAHFYTNTDDWKRYRCRGRRITVINSDDERPAYPREVPADFPELGEDY